MLLLDRIIFGDIIYHIEYLFLLCKGMKKKASSKDLIDKV